MVGRERGREQLEDTRLRIHMKVGWMDDWEGWSKDGGTRDTIEHTYIQRSWVVVIVVCVCYFILTKQLQGH